MSLFQIFGLFTFYEIEADVGDTHVTPRLGPLLTHLHDGYEDSNDTEDDGEDDGDGHTNGDNDDCEERTMIILVNAVEMTLMTKCPPPAWRH
jgi:hypothetical protein